jgi:uncharacterized protein YifE (UPF0438 family)
VCFSRSDARAVDWALKEEQLRNQAQKHGQKVQELEQKVQKLEEKSVELSRHENAITGTEAALCLRV